MKETIELDSILSKASLSDYAKIKKDELEGNTTTLSLYLNCYIEDNNLNKADVIEASQLSQSYAYQILNGRKTSPDRDKIIALCLALKMNYTEIQRALKLCNAGVLYSKNERDALLIICFNRSIYDIFKVNDTLVEYGFEPLKTSTV